MKEFDLEAAKNGAPVCTRDGRGARIICFDRKGYYPIVALVAGSDILGESIQAYSSLGVTPDFAADWQLFMCEGADTQFKPFDKVLVRDNDREEWQVSIFSHETSVGFICVGNWTWTQCIPYEGNEYLVGTTDIPKDHI